MSDDPTVPGKPSSRRGAAAMLALALLGAALALLGAGQTWAHGTVSFQATHLGVSASGHDVSGAPSALALVGLAAAVAVFAVRGVARYAVGALLALAGAGAAVAALLGAGSSAALDEKAGRAVGLTSAAAQGVTHTVWPWPTALGGLLILAAGVVALARGRDWPGMSSRYEAPGAAARPGRAPAPPAQTPADLWKALDRGEDPTEPAADPADAPARRRA